MDASESESIFLCSKIENYDKTRNFTHIDDIVDGIILAAFKGSGDDYGIGSDEKYSILDVVKALNCTPSLQPERAGNRMDGELKTEKIKELGWKCKNNLMSYLKEQI